MFFQKRGIIVVRMYIVILYSSSPPAISQTSIHVGNACAFFTITSSRDPLIPTKSVPECQILVPETPIFTLELHIVPEPPIFEYVAAHTYHDVGWTPPPPRPPPLPPGGRHRAFTPMSKHNLVRIALNHWGICIVNDENSYFPSDVL